jgi:hypothetical protein
MSIEPLSLNGGVVFGFAVAIIAANLPADENCECLKSMTISPEGRRITTLCHDMLTGQVNTYVAEKQ